MKYISHADLGGKSHPGAIIPEPGYETFHASWEPRAFAMTLAMGASGEWNLDMARSTRETLPDYDSLSYYEIWLAALERMLVARGLVRADELVAGKVLHPAIPVKNVLQAKNVRAVLAKGAATARTTDKPARFAAGDRVRLRAEQVAHHTRLPGYALGKHGRIERLQGVHVFPDTHAQGLGEHPEWLYTVVFEARELWGAEAAPGHFVSIDAWEPYLEPHE